MFYFRVQLKRIGKGGIRMKKVILVLTLEQIIPFKMEWNDKSEEFELKLK